MLMCRHLYARAAKLDKNTYQMNITLLTMKNLKILEPLRTRKEEAMWSFDFSQKNPQS